MFLFLEIRKYWSLFKVREAILATLSLTSTVHHAALASLVLLLFFFFFFLIAERMIDWWQKLKTDFSMVMNCFKWDYSHLSKYIQYFARLCQSLILSKVRQLLLTQGINPIFFFLLTYSPYFYIFRDPKSLRIHSGTDIQLVILKVCKAFA